MRSCFPKPKRAYSLLVSRTATIASRITRQSARVQQRAAFLRMLPTSLMIPLLTSRSLNAPGEIFCFAFITNFGSLLPPPLRQHRHVSSRRKLLLSPSPSLQSSERHKLSRLFTMTVSAMRRVLPIDRSMSVPRHGSTRDRCSRGSDQHSIDLCVGLFHPRWSTIRCVHPSPSLLRFDPPPLCLPKVLLDSQLPRL